MGMFGRRKARKPSKPNFVWVYGPKAGGVNSARTLSEIRASADARGRRARGRRILARQSTAQATSATFQELRQIRAEVRAEREGKALRASWDRPVKALLALVWVALIPVCVSVQQAGGASPNWSGVEVYSPGARPMVVTTSMRLPAVTLARMQSNSTIENDLWVGAGGDSSFGTLAGEWLPQAGWSAMPFAPGYWDIQGWAIVCHTSANGQYAQFPGWYSQSNYVVPVGTRLTATLYLRGRDIVAKITAVDAQRTITYVKILPELPHEMVVYPGVEGIWEAVGNENATPNMSVQNNLYMPVIPTTPIHLSVNVQYAGWSSPTIYADDIYQNAHKWANATRVTSERLKGGRVSTTATITDYLPR